MKISDFKPHRFLIPCAKNKAQRIDNCGLTSIVLTNDGRETRIKSKHYGIRARAKDTKVLNLYFRYVHKAPLPAQCLKPAAPSSSAQAAQEELVYSWLCEY
jgi:hypothetical protein